MQIVLYRSNNIIQNKRYYVNLTGSIQNEYVYTFIYAIINDDAMDLLRVVRAL